MTNFKYYFTNEIEQMNLTENHIEDEYSGQTIDPLFSQYTNVDLLDIYGGSNTNNDLSGWIETLEDNPIVVEQTMVPIMSLFNKIESNPDIIPKNVPLPQKKKIISKFGNFGKAYNDRDRIRKGCQIESAINFDRDAIIPDNESCYFTIFFGSYQEMQGG